MSLAGRLYSIFRAEVEERLKKAEERFGIDPDKPFDPSTVGDRGRAGAGGQSQGGGGGPKRSDRDAEVARWYANLEVPYGSDLDTVQAAWKKLVRAYHPDRHGQDVEKRETATEIVKELNNAYEQLKKHLENR